MYFPIAKCLKSKIGLLIILASITHFAFSTSYYSRTSGGYWNSNTTWSTVSNGNPINSGTYPQAGDFAYIGDGYTIYINASATASGITVGQGSSGILEFTSAGTFTLTIAGSLTINSGAKLWYNGNSSKTQKLYVSGNITNNGTIDFYSDANDVCNLYFNSSVNSIVSGTGTYSLNNVSLVKTSSAYSLSVESNAFENAIQALTLTDGRYIHNNTGLYNVNPNASSYFQIDADVIFEVPQGNVALSPNQNHVYLEGSLIVDGGTVYIASSAGNNGLRTSQSGSTVPYLEVSSGSLIVYGGISYASSSGSDPFSFKMTGGSILLNCGSNGTNAEPFFIPDVSESSFEMSGGTITLQSSSYGGSSTTDFSLCGVNGTVNTTGGTVVFGNGETASGDVFTFKPCVNAVQPNFKVTGDPSAAITLCVSQTNTLSFRLLSLYIDEGKTFDMRSLNGTSGDSKTMTITSTYDGTNAFYNDGTFITRSGTIMLSGTSPQKIAGSNKPTFYNFTMNNMTGASLGVSLDVSNQLSMTKGILLTSTSNILTCLANCSSNIGSSTSYINGPMINTVASTSTTTKNFPIGKNGSYRPLVLSVLHSSTASVTYEANVINSSAQALNYALPPTLSKVSLVRYWNINRQNVSNLISSTITLYYGNDDGVTDYASLRVARDNGSSAWLNLYGMGTTNGTGSITSNSFTGFNTIFTLANTTGGNNTLPVELLNFNAKKLNDKVQLSWSTASEMNSDYFEVERSTDEKNFVPVALVKAAGNSNVPLSYEMPDTFPLLGKNYYRLKEVDYNGSTTYSDVCLIQFDKKNQNTFIIYPNPSTSLINIHSSENNLDVKSLRIYDLNGKALGYKKIDSLNGIIKIKLDEGYASGVYKIVLQNSETILSETVLVNAEN